MSDSLRQSVYALEERVLELRAALELIQTAYTIQRAREIAAEALAIGPKVSGDDGG